MQANRMAFCRGEMFIWSKLGQKRPEMEVRTFARIKKVIWDQLLAAKAEIIQNKLFFGCYGRPPLPLATQAVSQLREKKSN